MARWQERLLRAANEAEGGLDRFQHRWHTALGWKIPIRVLAYRGFGTTERVSVRARVVRDRGIGPSSRSDGLWDNLIAAYKRYATHEIGGAQVRVRLGGTEAVAVTDAEGFIDLGLDLAAPLPSGRLWHDAELELLDPPSRTGRWRETARILAVRPDAEYGVISDIDDTVIQMGATHPLKKARALFLMNAHERLPFEGVSGFYRALTRGQGLAEKNPIFFISSSPWNLYDHLIELFAMHDIPEGPIFLRDWGLSERGFAPNGKHHDKLAPARLLLATYPKLPFILIGDSGQHDARLYEELCLEHPGRILAVYIRDVTRSSRREAELRAIAERVRAAGTEFVLTDDTTVAAAHAEGRGYIRRGGVTEVAEAKLDE
jgi:phosphatidate phosphatase APP1